MRFKWALMASVVLTSPAYAADQLQFGPVPSWVTSQAAGQPGLATDAPIEFLLSDSQVNLQSDATETYTHSVLRINNSQGLAAGNVIAGWDPAFDTVTVHQVTIRRGSQVIDVIGKGQKFSILRREQNLEQQTLNGQLTATLQPEGLQVGDILDVEMSVVRRDPTMRGHVEAMGNLAIPLRVEQARMRFVTPAKAVIRQRAGNALPQPVVSQKGSEKASVWAVGPLLPEEGTAFAPQRYARNRMVEVTDFQSWNDLAGLFLPLFEKASTIGASSPLRQELDRIKSASPDPSKRAELALQLVEQKIRYVNLALGVGGLVPASADDTWQRRFGDCKAKSVLLVALLREMGIDAVPVLVHSEDGDGMNERLPMVALFNHVVVRANIAGKTFWLDGTRTGDTSLENVEVPYFHWGLPIVANASLVKIVPPPLAHPYVETIIHTDASAGVAKPVPTTIELIMRGDVAILQNNMLSNLDPSLRDQAIRRQLQGPLDQFEIDKVTSSYDPATQVYRLRGEGHQTLDLDDGYYWTEVPTPGYKADFRRTGTRNLDAPVAISFPAYSRTVQTIAVPRDRAVQTSTRVEPINVTIAGVEYSRTFKNADGQITIDASNRALVPEISYAEAKAAQDRLRELDKRNIWIKLSNTTPVAADEVKQLIGHEPKTSADYFEAAYKLMNKDEATKAIGALDKAIELKPSNVQALAWRAQLKLDEGDREGAVQDAQAALKIEPSNVEMRSVLAENFRREGDIASALAQAAALAKADTAAAQIRRGQIYLSLDRPADALAAFDRALSFEKDPMTYVHRAYALSASDKAGLKRELDAALALDPSDAPALSGLAQIASQIGDHARALKLLDQAFLRSPDNIGIRHFRAVEMLLAGKTDAANKEFDAISAKDLSADELNGLCWTKALANVALDRAMQECERSLAKDESFATHDSKAMVYFRQSKFDEAIAEYNIALKDGEVAASLYGRSLAYSRKGDKASSDADAAKAIKLSPGIERTYSHYGINR